MDDCRERINSMVRQIAKHDRKAMLAKEQGKEDVAKAHQHLAIVFAEQVKILRQYEEEM